MNDDAQTGMIAVVGDGLAQPDIRNALAATFPNRAVYQDVDARNGFFKVCYTTPKWNPVLTASHEATGATLVLLGYAIDYSTPGSLQALIERYYEQGTQAFIRLNGVFVILLWDALCDELVVVNDRLGLYKLFYGQAGDQVVFCSHLNILSQFENLDRKISEQGLVEFLVTSHLVSSGSLIESFAVVPPATLVRVNSRGEILQSTYREISIEPDETRSLDYWADALFENLRTSIARLTRVQEHVTLPVTGGLDSRCLAAGSHAIGLRELQTMTYGPPYCYDVRVGKRVAQACNYPHTILALGKDYFSRYHQRALVDNDGEVSIESYPMYTLLEAARRGSHLLSGFLGDCLSGGHLVDFEQFEQGQRAENHYQLQYVRTGFDDKMLHQVLQPQVYERTSGLLFDCVNRELKECNADSDDHRALLLELRHRQSRYISYQLRCLGNRYNVGIPFADNDLLDVFLTIPLKFRLHQRVYRRMLVRHAPKLGSIIEARSQRSPAFLDNRGGIYTLPPSLLDQLKRAKLPPFIKWRLNKSINRGNDFVINLSNGWLGSFNRRHYIDYAQSSRENIDWYKSNLLDDHYLSGWFVRDAIEKMIDDHLAKRADHGIRLNNLVCFISWRRLNQI